MLKLQGHRGKVRALAFSPDGRRLASVAGREQRASLWELPGGRRTLSPDKTANVLALAFAPDGLAIVIAEAVLHRWNLADNALEEEWLCEVSVCWQVASSPDGSLLAAACYHRRGEADCFRVDLFRPAEPSGAKKFL